MQRKRKTMKNLMLIIALLWSGVANAQNAVAQQATKHIQAGNAKDLAALFAESLDLVVNETDEIVSKSQAEQILKKFFTNNVPKAFKIMHEGKTGLDIDYLIGELETSNGVFKVTINVKKAGETYVIHRFRIEKE
jgi:hypothetical protein